MLDPFRLCLALGPVAVYLLLVGLLNLARRPLLVSGTRDTLALGLAVAGLVTIGPVELFFPHAAASRFGPWVWVLLCVLYGMCLILVVLVQRPRLVLYNMSIDRLRPLLGEVVERLDPDARWAGDALCLPALNVQLHLVTFPALRNVSLVALGREQSHGGWRRLEQSLGEGLARVEGGRNAHGASFVGAALLIAAGLVYAVARDPQAVAQAVSEMLRR